MQGMVVTREYFQLTGLQPILGRSFVESEVGGRTPSAVLIGYELWQSKFNGDPHIIGKTIRISRFDTPPTVIGVMPPGVRFLPSPGAAQEPNYNVNGLVQFWIPVTTDPARIKAMQWDVVARLRDGATPAQAESELRILASRQAQVERSFEGFTPKLELLSNESCMRGCLAADLSFPRMKMCEIRGRQESETGIGNGAGNDPGTKLVWLTWCIPEWIC
jgi:putative ABC transport system permease protein